MDGGIDFGKFAQTAIAFQNLQETVRRNDLASQGLALERGRLDVQEEQSRIEKARNKQLEGASLLTQLDKLEDSPYFSGDKSKAAQLLVTRGNILRSHFGLKDVPIPNDVGEALGAFDAYKKLYQSLGDQDLTKREEAMADLAVANPKQFRLLLDDYAKGAELPEKLQRIRTLTTLNEAKLTALNQKNAAAQIQDGLYGLHIAELRAPLTVLQGKEISAHLKKMQGLNETQREAYLKLYPDVAKTMASVQVGAQSVEGIIGQLQTDLQTRQQAIENAQQKNGVAPQELVDEAVAYENVLKARQAQSEWVKDRTSFYSPDKYKAVLAAEQNLRALQGKPRAAMEDIAKQRLDLSLQLRDDKLAQNELQKNKDLGLQRAQEVYLQRLKEGDDDLTAGVAAAQTVRTEFPGIPVDLTKLENPSKKGKLDIGIKMGQEDVSRQFKTIEAAQGVVDYVADLRERIQANPAIVGRGAQFSTALAGSAQQLRAIVRNDPSAAKHLNTKNRDEAEAFYEILVYLQARSMDASGPLDLKVVENARKVLGSLDSFTTGPQQILNKLQVVQSSAERSMRNARKRIKGGVQEYVEPVGDKKVSEMTDEELLRTVLGGAQ